MQRVLLTGASGFIGCHLVRRLHAENCEIRCLVRKTSNTEWLDPFGVRLIVGDLNDPKSLVGALDDCDTVFHLAGRVRAKKPAEFSAMNRDGTRNLAVAASQRPDPPVLVDVSSLAVMGPANRGVPKRETDLPAPISDYGRSKLEGERALSEFADKIPCSIVRPGIVFGEADRMNLELFKTVDRLGFCPIPGWKDRIYSWIHAADLVELLLRVAKSGERLSGAAGNIPGQGIYFASSDDGVKLSEIGRMIGRSLGRSRTVALRCPPVAVLSVSMFYEILKRTTGKDQPYDRAKAIESTNHWRCSPEKAERQFGFAPLLPLEERIVRTTEWYRRQGWL